MKLLSTHEDEPGARLSSYGRTPRWMPWLVGLLLAVVLLPVGHALIFRGELALPSWLQTQFGVLFGLALVMAVIGWISSLAGQLISELRGVPSLAAVHANGLVIRLRLSRQFVPWESVTSIREMAMATQHVSDTGATSAGATLIYYEIDCGLDRPVLVREGEGGAETASIIAEKARFAAR